MAELARSWLIYVAGRLAGRGLGAAVFEPWPAPLLPTRGTCLAVPPGCWRSPWNCPMAATEVPLLPVKLGGERLGRASSSSAVTPCAVAGLGYSGGEVAAPCGRCGAVKRELPAQ